MLPAAHLWGWWLSWIGSGATLARPECPSQQGASGNVLTGRTVTWSSSDTARATVDSTGLVKGIAPGQLTVTASSQAKSGVATITVTVAPTGSITVYTDPTASFATPRHVTFDEIDATPVNDTIAGRTPFDGRRYASQGFTFASPNGYDLYIAPGGLFWNASNSLSVGRFPFDPIDIGPSDPLIP